MSVSPSTWDKRPRGMPCCPVPHCWVLQEEQEGLGFKLVVFGMVLGSEGLALAQSCGCFIHFDTSSLHLDCTELCVMVSSVSV